MSYIEFRNITKTYGNCVSCNDISLSIQTGTVHAIIGENGAGKSTLMKLLGGLIPATSGQMFLNSKIYSPRSAQDAFHNRIAFIHQHFVLAEQLTALDNLALNASADGTSLALRPNRQVAASATALLEKFGWQMDLHQTVSRLSVGEQQRLEILKALMQNPEIIIFDEPTAVLTPQESQELMKFIQQLKAEGKTVILISHKLHEIKSVADNISILRQGCLVAQHAQADLSIEQMAELMIGRRLQRPEILSTATTTPILTLPHSEISLYVGEILGVAGIEGNGQEELISNLLMALRQKEIMYGDITEDRLRLSVFPELDLTEHMLLRHKKNFTAGFIREEALAMSTQELVEKWDVRPREINKPLADFSGGNQQKFVVGRELWGEPQVLLAAHPTRGVDLGAQEKIHAEFLNFTRRGKSIVLVSSDLDEVLFLSNRFIILNKNKIFGPFHKDQLGEQEIGLYMAGKI